MMVNEYIAKLLKENNVLMRALAERNTEVQNLRLMVAKLNQQNWQLAQAHSQMLAELNLGKDRLKAAQHELGCTSTALKVKTQDLEEQKKLNKQNMRIHNSTNLEGRVKPAEIAVETSQLASHKRTCLPNRKRPQRSQSLAPMPITNQTTTEEENPRKPALRRKSIILKAESCLPTEDLFEIEDTKFPMCSGDNKGGSSLQLKPSAPTTKPVKVEEEEVQLTSSLKRTSLGRPLRRAAEKVNCYKEMPLNAKLRRSE
ncbi:Shugoshin-1 [Dendrobium catenatum]|uniref:Shugoshin-1 n=2 Tax=Dendrobium catenatum TaxID=906689 RepID=A0A2I0WR12_9ASPA|nr:Shugoshin-1 [Dendrobium catenatum]